MDYEKLHKDTIAKLQEMVNSGKITVETACGICADFVPESEDEMMIKFIKNQLFNIKKTITENYELDAKLTKAIDWLEKQGEQKLIDKEYTFKAIPRLLEMINPTDKAKSYCQKLIDSLEQEGYSTDAKLVRECLKQMNGEKVAMATMDEQKPA